MLGIALALAAAAVYGSGDFLGGISTKRAGLWAVVVVSQAIGGVATLAAALLIRDPLPSPHALALAAAGGVAGGIGVALLYRGLAVGRMSVVAPVTGVVAVTLPVAVGIVRGERAPWEVWLGIAAAAAAVALVSSAPGEHLPDGAPRNGAGGLREALGAGVGFGLLYVLFAAMGTTSALWPTVAARSASVPLLALTALAVRGNLRPRKGSLATIAPAGLCDVSANVLYLLALRHTLLAIAAVITSLYPASTVLLARVVLRERLSGAQWIGVACGALGVVLIAAR